MRKFKLLLLAVFALVGVSSAFAMDKPTPKASALATDGETVQYLYNVGAKAFFVGANDYGTRASFDPNHGYQFKVKANGDGTFTLNDRVESKNNSWQQVFVDWSNQAYVDNTSDGNRFQWKIEIAGDGTFTISHPKVEGYLGVVPTNNDTKLQFTKDADAQVTWIAVSEEDYDAWLESFSELPGYVTATSFADVEGKLFRIQNDTEGKALCFGVKDEQNMYYEPFDVAFTYPSLFKVEKILDDFDDVFGKYYLRPYKLNGELNNVWGWGGYFNSQKATDWCCFCLGLNNQYGQDIKNGAVWDIQYVDGQGFTIKNIGTGKYLKDAAPAKYDEPAYWTFAYEDKFIIPVGKTALAKYREALAAAKAVDQTQTMPTDVLNALIDAIDKYAEDKVLVESATAESVQTATTALVAAAAPAATFAEYRQALADAQAIDLTPEMNTALKAEFENALVTYAEDKVITATATLESIQQATNTLTNLAKSVTQSIATFAVAKEILAAANGYDDAGKQSYASDETIAAIQAAYTAGTLEAVTDAQKTAAAAAFIAACKAQVQPADGCNMTPYIVNPSFEDQFTSWTNSGMQTQNNTSFEKAGTLYAEAWQPNGTKKVTQTITLPNGLYTLSAKCKARGVTSAKLFAGDVETPITIADATDTYSVQILSIGKEITIGYEGVGTGASNSWICVDNFQLTYVRQLTDEEMIPLAKEDYQEALADAKAVDLTAKMNAALKTQFESALETYAEDKVITATATLESIQQATTILDNLTKSVTQSIAAYAATGAIIAKAESLDETGKAAFNANADIVAIQNAYKESTMEEDKSAELVGPYRAAVKAQTTAGADMTGAIINPSFEEADGIGWTMISGNQKLHGGNADNYCAESWHATFTLSQVVEGLPNGTYSLTAQGFYNQDGSDNDNLPVFYANGQTATFPFIANGETSMGMASTSFSASKYTIEPIIFEVTDGTVTFGAKLEVNTTLWCIWDNFKLTFVEPVPVPFPEDGAKGYLCNVKTKLLVTANGELVAKTEADKDRDLMTVWLKGSDKKDGSVVRLAAGKAGDGKWNSLRFNSEGKVVCETEDYCKWNLAKDGSYYTLYHTYGEASGGGYTNTGKVGTGYLTLDPVKRTFALLDQATEFSLWQFVTWEEYEELTTTISFVSEKAAPAKGIFNAAGQQMKSLQKGLNIVDGQKIYVK